ncbi:SH3 domain-containing protein [Vallitalea pronyensis]|uniref:SH3 domain-containing protein n=1 Tax=Vallitalea pronyensis TaxID=1348613 RepID=A0A8J8MNT9_9FIRM|nr:NlpC/P60 family protein [Vallitalea pronyensis]QUI25352.1 SH3 domain-containing protein [Vallitalea pronyensis]
MKKSKCFELWRFKKMNRMLIFSLMIVLILPTGKLFASTPPETNQEQNVQEISKKKVTCNNPILNYDLPHVTEDMLYASFWTDKVEHPNDIIQPIEKIQALNKENINNLDYLVDIFSLGESVTKSWLIEEINNISKISQYKRYNSEGQLLTQAYYDQLIHNMNEESIEENTPITYGIAVKRTQIRTWPTYDKAYKTSEKQDLDRFLETAAYTMEPIAIFHTSRDGEWYFAATYNYYGWIPVEDIAIAEKQEILDLTSCDDFLVVTGDKVYARGIGRCDDHRCPSKIQYDMGVRIPYVKVLPSSIHKNKAKNHYIIKRPIRNENGMMEIRYAKISKKSDVNVGYLDYTIKNIMNQAFKFYGEIYGWGGDNNARDCSAFIMDIFRSFGITLPRNAGQQVPTTGLIYDFENTTDKLKLLETMKPGTAIYFDGHVMLYVGQHEQRHYIIHDVIKVNYMNDDNVIVPYVLEQVALTSLDLYNNSHELYIHALTKGNLFYWGIE